MMQTVIQLTEEKAQIIFTDLADVIHRLDGDPNKKNGLVDKIEQLLKSKEVDIDTTKINELNNNLKNTSLQINKKSLGLGMIGGIMVGALVGGVAMFYFSFSLIKNHYVKVADEQNALTNSIQKSIIAKQKETIAKKDNIISMLDVKAIGLKEDEAIIKNLKKKILPSKYYSKINGKLYIKIKENDNRFSKEYADDGFDVYTIKLK